MNERTLILKFEKYNCGKDSKQHITVKTCHIPHTVIRILIS